MTQGLELEVWSRLSFTAQKRARETTVPTKIGCDKQKNLDDTCKPPKGTSTPGPEKLPRGADERKPVTDV
jgi:hypothetical protein